MSIYSDAYWFSYTTSTSNNDKTQTDPTETVVEWLVESVIGQQSVFTYDHNNIDSKNVVKPTAYPITLYAPEDVQSLTKTESVFFFPQYISRLTSRTREILTPPPNSIA
jgi:hypothetical protein